MSSDSLGHPSIRNYRREDLSTLHEIDRICFPDYMAYSRAELAFYLGHPAAISKVAELDGRIFGFVVGRMESSACAHVITLDVIPEARRRGVGSALMELLHEEFRARGITQVVLEVAAVNEEAQRFYARLGYGHVGTLRHYYKARVDAFRMLLRL